MFAKDANGDYVLAGVNDKGFKPWHRIVLEGHLGADCPSVTTNPGVLRSWKAEALIESEKVGLAAEKMEDDMSFFLEQKMVLLKFKKFFIF